MKILLVTEFYSQDNHLRFTGGVEARTYYLAKELKKRHQLSVISRSTKTVPVSLISVFSRLVFQFTAVFRGCKAEADIVEGSNFVSYLPAFIIAKIKGVPAIAWYADVFKGTWREKFGLVGIFGEIIEQIGLSLPWNHVIALSQQTKEKLVKSGLDKNQISVIYPGVNSQEVKSVKAKKFKHPTICCISRLVGYKRINDLIRAFFLIKKQLPSARLIIIGEGPQESQLKSEALSLGINNSVAWQRNLSRQQLLTILKSSQVFCLPSLVEGFGLVTLEAIAAGLPYVNADTAINREVTHKSQGGLLFKPTDSQDLADKIIKLFKNKKVYSRKLKEGKELLKNYSWQQSAKTTLAIYKSALS